MADKPLDISFEEVVKPVSDEIELSVFYGIVVNKSEISRLLKYLGTEYPLPESVFSMEIV